LSDKALIDTSVLTDALLKQRSEGTAARDALTKFKQTELPVYAIKEFKAGPLRYYVWFHNKVVTTNRWEDAVDAIRKLGVTPQRNRQSTALQALVDFESHIGRSITSALAAKYPGSDVNEVKRSEARLWLKTLILRAWRKRRKVTTRVVSQLSCYPEAELKINSNGTLDDRPVGCPVQDCCMREPLIRRPDALASLLKACDRLPEKPETHKRRQVLRQLVRTPKRPLSDADCRKLGDAIFALQCPQDAVILTTNVVDHEPLANALGLSVARPA
jgi:hypothetical protein